MKIPKKTTENYFERLEIEKPWSEEIFNEIISTINSYFNINIFNSHKKYFNQDPELTLITAGFKVVQLRETYRNLINAINNNSKQTEYEFAIDNTTYIIKNYRISNLELEVESKTKYNNKSILNNFVN